MRATSSLLVLLSGFLLALGVTQPLITFERLVFFTESPSLVAIITALATSGDLPLAIVVALVSVVFPVAKLIGMQLLVTADPDNATQIQKVLGYLSKWSMMDVVLVAIVIFAAKTSGLASAVTQPGVWFYALSAITGAFAAAIPLRASRKAAAENAETAAK